MQKYNKLSKDKEELEKISGYMLVKLNINQMQAMSKFGLSVSDARHLEMYEEFLSLREDGVPKERIYQYFRGKYHVSESTSKRIVKRFSHRATL